MPGKGAAQTAPLLFAQFFTLSFPRRRTSKTEGWNLAFARHPGESRDPVPFVQIAAS
jgi:hypothetical protein